jgi:hypothetical protein
MRGLEKLFLLLFVALVALGLNARHWLLPPHRGVAVTVEQPSEKHGSKTRSKTLAKGSESLPPELLSSTTVDLPVSAPFPEPKDLPPGMTSEQLRTSFGEPTARVTRPDNGELSERFYYVNKERRVVTVANLQDGVVVSAESKPY